MGPKSARCLQGVLGMEQREGRAGAAKGLPYTLGMEHTPFLDHALSRMLGIGSGLSKITGKCGQTPSHRACNTQPVPAGIVWHVFKTVARVCGTSLECISRVMCEPSLPLTKTTCCLWFSAHLASMGILSAGLCSKAVFTAFEFVSGALRK